MYDQWKGRKNKSIIFVCIVIKKERIDKRAKREKESAREREKERNFVNDQSRRARNTMFYT